MELLTVRNERVGLQGIKNGKHKAATSHGIPDVPSEHMKKGSDEMNNRIWFWTERE